jgi:hypothetical protein
MVGGLKALNHLDPRVKPEDDVGKGARIRARDDGLDQVTKITLEVVVYLRTLRHLGRRIASELS